MNRRLFLSMFGVAAAGIALDKAIPFGRVWSFPSEILIPRNQFLTIDRITREGLEILNDHFKILNDHLVLDSYFPPPKIGNTVNVRMPRLYA